MRIHRRPLALVLLPAIFSAGCSTCSSPEDNASRPVASASASRLTSGDRVVAEYARAAFFEGKVSSVGEQDLQIIEEGTGATRAVDAANVYRLPSRARKAWTKGALAICRMGEHRWLACRVRSAVRGKVSVVDEKGKEATLPADSLLVPTAVTRVNLVQVFERVDKAKSFSKGLREAGPLHRPHGWEPRKAEGVLVRIGGTYVSAVVRERRANLLLVQVAGHGEKPRAVAPDDVWPQPPVDASMSVGSYACIRPPGGEHTWHVVRIDERKDSKLLVSTPSGDRRLVEAKDLLPFEARKASVDP